ncbi:MAG: hypothetical protein QXM27_02865 [Candidatus Pacearchaeota archaeon]
MSERFNLHKTILEKRVKPLISYCLSNPEINKDALFRFFNRDIKWEIITSYAVNGKDVKCEICGQNSKTSFWCHPCIHKNWCCYCCILLGIPDYW